VAIPPNIPTSFVPKQPVETRVRQDSGINMFLVVAFVIAGIAILMAIGVFAYAHFLRSEADQKAAELQTAEAGVDQSTVEGFLRLKDRLTSAQTILDQHIVLSQFFSVLENLTLTSVRFTSLTVTVEPDRSADIKMTGTAKDFNALAAQSAALAGEPRIKQAIFSGISADKTGVAFSLDAKLDPSLIAFTAPAAGGTAAAAPAAPSAGPVGGASTTAATTTP